MTAMKKRILIIGGGVSGLALAEIFETRKMDYQLVEARARFGGRIKTTQIKGRSFDLGPAWIWPHQPRITNMIARLGLETFEQYFHGDALFENAQGQTQRARGFASMAGSFRVNGGLSALTDALRANLSQERLHLSTEVTSMCQTSTGISATFNASDVRHFTHVVLAIPPRIAANIRFDPPLPEATLDAMKNVPTWMAGQAKAIALYDRAFWRDANLSGDIISQRGPLGEIHDASPQIDGPYALFGFIATPPSARLDESILKEQIQQQLIRIFGSDAAAPRALLIKDWATDRLAATPRDLAPLLAHPRYGLPHEMAHIWEGRLRFAGTEVGTDFGGYIEGALEAAEQVGDDLL